MFYLKNPLSFSPKEEEDCSEKRNQTIHFPILKDRKRDPWPTILCFELKISPVDSIQF